MLELQKVPVSHVYIDGIADMIFQIYHLHLEQYYIQQQHDLNLRNLC